MKQTLKKLALEMAAEHGLVNLSRKDLCARAGIADGSFPYLAGQSFTDFITDLIAEVEPPQTRWVSKNRVHPDLRRGQLLAVATHLAKTVGYQQLTRGEIAELAEVSTGLVSHYFNTIEQLRFSIMKYAVQQEVLEVVAQGLIAQDEQALCAPRALKRKAVALIAGR